MRNAVIRFTQDKCVAGKFKPPEAFGLTFPHETICVFKYF